MNKKTAQFMNGQIKEIETRLNALKAVLKEPAYEFGSRMLEMNAVVFFNASKEPFHTARVLEWLEQVNAKTVGDVVKFSYDDLRLARNLGPVAIRYLERCLAKHGLYLKDLAPATSN